MNPNIGLWIDHQRAAIIIASSGQEDVREILRHGNPTMENAPLGATFWFAPTTSWAGIKQEWNRDRFYNRIIASVHVADSLLIFGPDEAKAELRQRLECSKSKPRHIDIETASVMSPREIMSKVRSHFREVDPSTRI